MEVILLEKVDNLGEIGNLVKVKDGFARNFLLRKNKALRANKANIAYFEKQKAEIEANNARKKADALKIAANMKDVSVIIVRQASESGFLFGSVRAGDIVAELAKQGYEHISKDMIKIASPFKAIGNYQVAVVLHPEVSVAVNVRIETVQQQEHSGDEEEAEGALEEA